MTGALLLALLVWPFDSGLSALAQGGQESAFEDPFADPLPASARLRLGSSRLRHLGAVRAVAFSADGRLLASGGSDQANPE